MDRSRLSNARSPSWPAYLGWGATLLLIGVTGWLVLRACGIEVAGHQVRFQWCTAQARAHDAMGHEWVREEILRNEIASVERELLEPDLCGDNTSLRCEAAPQTASTEELIVVLDASGSMRWSTDIPLELEKELTQLFEESERLNRRRISEIYNIFDNYPGRNRLHVAREAIIQLSLTMNPDRLRLYSFRNCGDVRDYGVFLPRQEDQLRNRLDSVTPVSSTDLAEAIRIASRAPGDPNDPVNMLVISDGFDSCGGDPCEEARRAKATRPGLVINVYDLAEHGSLQCLTESTGGTYSRLEQGAELAAISEQMRDTAEFRSSCAPTR